jgi:hypothetical protein
MKRVEPELRWFGVGVLVLLSFALGRPAAAAEPKSVDFQAFMQDTQLAKRDQHGMTLVIWFPPQCWNVLLANDAKTTDERKKELAKAFSPYIVMAVVDMKFGPMGNPTYMSEADVRSKTRLVDDNGNTYSPLDEDDIDLSVQATAAAMKPGMAAVAGPMGKNMHILMFSATDSNGRKIADAEIKGSLVVKFDKQEFRWKLPLGSLLLAKTCTKCKEKCSGAWDFCPWCGTKLPGK